MRMERPGDQTGVLLEENHLTLIPAVVVTADAQREKVLRFKLDPCDVILCIVSQL